MIFVRNVSEGMSPENVPNFRSGDILSLKILKAVDGGWQVSVKGKLYTAEILDLPVSPRQIIKARVLFKGNTIIFKAIQPGVGSSQQSSTINSSDIERIAIRAFKITGLEYSQETLSQVLKISNIFQRKDEGFFRFLALLLDKGIPLLPEYINSILCYDYSGRRRGKNDKKDQKDEKRQKIEIIEEISEQISGDPVFKASNPLLLMNHLMGRHDNWIFLPIILKRGEKAIDGMVKIQTEIERKTDSRRLYSSSIKKIVVTAYTETQKWAFIINGYNEKIRNLKIFTDGEKNEKKIKNAVGNLSKIMRELHIELEDSIHDWSFFDGFEEKIQADVNGIDTYA